MGLLVSSLFKVSQCFVLFCFHFESLDISNIIFLPVTILNYVMYIPTASLLKIVIEV